MKYAIAAAALLALAGCTAGLTPGQTPVSSITFPMCPPGTKVSGEVGAGGGFGGAVTFSARFDCNTPAGAVPTPATITPLSVK